MKYDLQFSGYKKDYYKKDDVLCLDFIPWNAKWFSVFTYLPKLVFLDKRECLSIQNREKIAPREQNLLLDTHKLYVLPNHKRIILGTWKN